MRHCTKCGEHKLISAFSTHNGRKDGHQFWCKACKSAYQVEYRKTAAGRESNNRGMSHQWKKYPERVLARVTINNAVESGEIERKPCNVCGKLSTTKKPTHAHHWSYAKRNWFDLIWLCKDHHCEIHALLRQFPCVTRNTHHGLLRIMAIRYHRTRKAA